MQPDDLKQIWHQRLAEASGELTPEDTMSEIRSKVERLDRDVRNRDLRETIAAALVFATCVAVAVFFSQPLARLAGALGAASSVLVVWRLRAARRRVRPSAAELPLRAYLQAELDKVDAQVRLLRSVAWWYVAPITTAAILFLVGVGGGHGRVVTAVMVAMTLALGVGVWALNQRAVERDLMPLRRDLEVQREALD